MKKIMIVEDDKNICLELKALLDSSGYSGIILDDFKNSKEKIIKCNPDLLLLDINIPYMNGEELIKEIRKESNMPIIMVTSRSSEIDEALSISYGADDYITKPYNPTILLLRISSILKRVGSIKDTLKYRDLNLNLGSCSLENDKVQIILTKNEMIIFNYLLNNRGNIVTRDELMTCLWKMEEYVNDNALTVNISRLRAKLRDNGYFDTIETRKKIGYILL